MLPAYPDAPEADLHDEGVKLVVVDQLEIPDGRGGVTETFPDERARLSRKLPLLTWLSCFMSMFGTRTLGIAYPLLALAITRSPTEAGWVGFWLSVPMLLVYIPAGVVADRFPCRLIMMGSEFGRALVALSVFAAVVISSPAMIHLEIAAFAEGTLWVLYAVAETALLRELLSKDEYKGVVAGSEGLAHFAIFAGRPVGGMLFGAGQIWPFFANTLFFLVSFVALAFVRVPIRPSPPPPQNSSASGGVREGLTPLLLREIRAGVAELWGNPFLRRAMLVTAVGNLMVNTLIMVFLAGSETLSPLAIGAVLGAGGLGGAIGSAVAPWLLNSRLRMARTRMLVVQVWVWAAALSIPAIGREPIFYAAATLLTGITGSLSNVVIRTEEVTKVRPEMTARVMSVHRLVVHGAIALAAPIGGFLVAFSGRPAATDKIAVVMLFGAVVATVFWRRRVRVSLRPKDVAGVVQE